VHAHVICETLRHVGYMMTKLTTGRMYCWKQSLAYSPAVLYADCSVVLYLHLLAQWVIGYIEAL